MNSKRIVFNFMNAIVSTSLTHHKKRFKTIIEAKIVIEKNFENEIEIEIEKTSILINLSKNRRIAIKSNAEIVKWKIIMHEIAKNLLKMIQKKKAINRRNLRRSDSSRSRKNYQTYVHHDDFILKHRTKNDSSYDWLWCNVQLHFSDENQEMKSARNRRHRQIRKFADDPRSPRPRMPAGPRWSALVRPSTQLSGTIFWAQMTARRQLLRSRRPSKFVIWDFSIIQHFNLI